ncbi:hypothetical protein M758_UG179100 [Ceratodon purpureus]|nr:hypothetical protein M758_UG179100 [Ceratodon purpureus]
MDNVTENVEDEGERSGSEDANSSEIFISGLRFCAADDDGGNNSSEERESNHRHLQRATECGHRPHKRQQIRKEEVETRSRKKRVVDDGGSFRHPQSTMHCHVNSPPVAPGTSNSIPRPDGFTWMQVPNGTSPAFTRFATTDRPNTSIPGQWQFIPSQVNTHPSSLHTAGSPASADLLGSKTSSVNEDSLKRKIRRQKKRKADEEARKTEEQGLRPYIVQVKPSGLIDSGCKGHLQWQELVRDLTPRFLDLSIPVYELQNAQSRFLLWEALKQKFEFVDNEVTQSSCEKMIKTWLRKDRERVKRTHGSSLKPPPGYTDQEWESLRKYWNSDSTKQRSERMSATRQKVVNISQLGRYGYAGKEAKLRSERETSPGWTDVGEEIEGTYEAPVTDDMHRRNSKRLSAMERNQAETNRRLDDIKTILESVIINNSSAPNVGNEQGIRIGTPSVGETFGTKVDGNSGDVTFFPAEGSSEQRWDRVDKTSDHKAEFQKDQSGNVTNTVVDVTNVSEVSKSIEDIELVNENTQKPGIKLRIGDWVWLAEKAESNILVATGQVSGLADGGMFHNRPIPKKYVRINVESVAVNVPLYVPVDEADQTTLTDALGSSVLWPTRLTFRKI